MSWILVRADFDPIPLDLSPFVDTFRDFGVENTLEDELGLEGCVVEVDGSENIVDSLRTRLLEQGAATVTVEPYVEQDWEIAWKQFFKPRRIGARILVVPTWETAETHEGDVVLLLDPGQAFGTGDHPTTRLCLELLDHLPLEGKRVADVGCGSGILAIATVKLGARVVAIDIDPVALAVAKENAERNGVEFETYCGDGLTKLVSQPDPKALKGVPQDETPLSTSAIASEERSDIPQGEPFDVVVSNIISATLIRLAPQLVGVLKSGGHWIVSGIIEDNWPEVKKSAESLGLTLVEHLQEDGWVAANLKKS